MNEECRWPRKLLSEAELYESLKTGRKPSTRFPPGGLVELILNKAPLYFLPWQFFYYNVKKFGKLSNLAIVAREELIILNSPGALTLHEQIISPDKLGVFRRTKYKQMNDFYLE